MKSNNMDLVNKYSVSKLSEDDVFIFSVILCDNEIDRDNERFSIDTLYELEKLFLGKTGIYDHDSSAKNQIARIFKTKVLNDETRKTKANEVYHYLKAKAYMVRSDKNEELIKEILSGIKKEVSVGCNVTEIICSKCGKNNKKDYCNHGRKDGAHKILKKANDAYEWSFVAIPSQKNAGVVKVFNIETEEDFSLKKVFSKLNKNENLSDFEGKNTLAYIKNLEELAIAGENYKKTLLEEVIKESYLSKANMDIEVVKSIAEKLNLKELLEFKKGFKEKRPNVQLYSDDSFEKINDNNDYKLI